MKKLELKEVGKINGTIPPPSGMVFFQELRPSDYTWEVTAPSPENCRHSYTRIEINDGVAVEKCSVCDKIINKELGERI